jgi:hypothetical protein
MLWKPPKGGEGREEDKEKKKNPNPNVVFDHPFFIQKFCGKGFKATLSI